MQFSEGIADGVKSPSNQFADVARTLLTGTGSVITPDHSWCVWHTDIISPSISACSSHYSVPCSVPQAFVTAVPLSHHRTVLWCGVGTCVSAQSCRLGSSLFPEPSLNLPCRVVVLSDGVLIAGDVPSTHTGRYMVVCDFIPIAHAIPVMSSLVPERDLITLTHLGAVVARLKMKPSAIIELTSAVQDAKVKAHDAGHIAQSEPFCALASRIAPSPLTHNLSCCNVMRRLGIAASRRRQSIAGGKLHPCHPISVRNEVTGGAASRCVCQPDAAADCGTIL